MKKSANLRYRLSMSILTAVMFSFLSITDKAVSQESEIILPPNTDNGSYQEFADESDSYYNAGLDFLTSNQYSKAIESLEKALSISPKKDRIRVNLSIAYINRGTYYFNQLSDFNKSASDYRNAIYLLKYDNYIPNYDLTSENLGIAKENLDNMMKAVKISTEKSSRLNSAKELRGQGKFREALVEYNEALQGNQTDLPVLIAVGDMYSLLQNEKKAADYYQKAVAYNTNNTGLHIKIARSLNSSGDIESSLKEYNIALKTAKTEEKPEVIKDLENIWIQKLKENPQDATAHMNLGVIFQKKGDYESAMQEYQFAESINPNDITTRLNIGTLLQAKKDYSGAVSAYDTILQIKPDNLTAHYNKGTALRDSGQLEEAVKEFQFVIGKDPANTNAKEALFETIKKFPNTAEVTEIFKTFANNNPTDVIAQYKYAYNLHTLNRTDEALEFYKKVIALDPKFTDAYLNAAKIYKEKKQTPAAICILESGLKALPSNKKITDMLNGIKAENATLRYENALKFHNDGKYDLAIKEYLSIIQISEPDSDLYVNLGAAYQASKNLTGAAAAYKKATEINKKNSTAFYYLGTVYSAQGKVQDAAANYQKALALDPDNADIKKAFNDAKKTISDGALQKGIDQYNKAKYSEALLTFNTLTMKDPSNGLIYYYRGMVYDELKKYQLAVADYKLAVKFKPDLTYAYYAVAVDYDTLKNYPEAKKWYTFFITTSKDKTDQYVKYAKARIRQI